MKRYLIMALFALISINCTAQVWYPTNLPGLYQPNASGNKLKLSLGPFGFYNLTDSLSGVTLHKVLKAGNVSTLAALVGELQAGSGSTKMVINTNGIGVISASANDNMIINPKGSGATYFGLGTGSGGIAIVNGSGNSINQYLSGSGTDSYFNLLGGNFGIGTNLPNHRLDVNGNIGFNGYLNASATDGPGGFGFRNNAGTMEFKNSGGTWTSLAGSGSGTVTGVSSGNTNYITVTNGTTAPVISAVVGNSSSNLVARIANGGLQIGPTSGTQIDAENSGVDLVLKSGTTSIGKIIGRTNNNGTTVFEFATNGDFTLPRYSSGNTTPAQSGTEHILTVDANGLVGHRAIASVTTPTLNQVLTAGYTSTQSAEVGALTAGTSSTKTLINSSGLSVVSSSTNDNLVVNAKGTGIVYMGLGGSSGGLAVVNGSTSANHYFPGLSGSAYINALGGTLAVGSNSANHTLDVNGNIGFNGYLNASATDGSGGYGFRNNGGTMEFKNSGGSWTSFSSGIGGSVSSVTSANGDIAIANTTSTPVLTLNSSTSATASSIGKRDASGDFSANQLLGTNGIFSGNVTVTDAAYSSLWNGSSQVPTKNAIYDKIESMAGITTSSAIYTPTYAGGTNIASTSNSYGKYIRVGNIVTVNGAITAVLSNANSFTNLYMSLPVSSSTTDTYDIIGSGTFTTGGVPGAVFVGTGYSSGAGLAIVSFISGASTTIRINYSFSYSVID